MEKQKSFSAKPIKFLVSSFTITFFIIFFVFFFTWVIKSSPLVHLGSRNLGVQSSREPRNFSSDYELKNSILIGGNTSSQAAAYLAESEGSLTSPGNNLVLDDVNVSDSTKSVVGVENLDVKEVQEVDDVVEKGNLVVMENSTSERDVVTSDVNEHSCGIEDKSRVDCDDSYSTKSAGGIVGVENLEVNVVEKGNLEVMENSTSGRDVITSDSSERSSIRCSIEDKSKVGCDLEGKEVEELNDVVDKGNVVGQHSSIQTSAEDKSKVDCDVTRGRWVFDESYPLYTYATCPYIDEGFDCNGNGRLDKDYMKWRWQPQDCDIPRFNATNMLELIRGKRLVFVGDSLNRNQWESMLCLLMGGVKDPKKVYEARGRKITKERGNYCFKFEEYKCTVEYYVSHYLVHESKARIGKKKGQTLRIDTMDKGSSRWRGADILVFNTAHWWNHHKTKAGINYYQEGDQVLPRLDVTVAFQRALLTWAFWADKNINPRKTRVFFRSSAPAHFSGGQWNTGGHCREAFRPINETSYDPVNPEKNLIMEEVLRKMKTPVTFLNITRLSDYRPDGHPSMYGRRSINPGVQDCSHWCLPGVPDVWNELLYYYLQSRTKAIS